MKIPKINCIHFDCGAGGKCKKLPKRFKFFRRGCSEVYNLSPKKCKLHEPFPRPNRLTPPEPPPCREYKCYGSNMVRTKESIQASYEWRCKLYLKDD